MPRKQKSPKLTFPQTCMKANFYDASVDWPRLGFSKVASDVRTNGISRNERREGVQGGVSQSVRHGQTHKVTVTISNNGRRRQRRVEND